MGRVIPQFGYSLGDSNRQCMLKMFGALGVRFHWAGGKVVAGNLQGYMRSMNYNSIRETKGLINKLNKTLAHFYYGRNLGGKKDESHRTLGKESISNDLF